MSREREGMYWFMVERGLVGGRKIIWCRKCTHLSVTDERCTYLPVFVPAFSCMR